ncbi:hypothetical protein JCM10207_008683 [Rhodosporidiobolus poonsookiae]
MNPLVGAPPGKRGPLRKSCEACRIRRVKCVRKDGAGEDDPCEGCSKKGLQCTSVKPHASSLRTGKRIELARDLYGSTSTSTATPLGHDLVSTASSSTALVARSAANSLVVSETEGAIGYELLRLYNQAGQAGETTGAVYPLPVFNSAELLRRYESAGRKLSALSLEDRLLTRTVFAMASRLLPPNSAGSSPLPVQLLRSAQDHADANAVWRSPRRDNAVVLLLLYLAAGKGEIATPDARPYLGAVVSHIRELLHYDPAVVKGHRTNTTGLSWCVGFFDVLAAVEQGRAPLLPDGDYARIFDASRAQLPTRYILALTLAGDPWSLTGCMLGALAFVIAHARKLATFLAGYPSSLTQQPEFLTEAYARMDEVYEWASGTLDLARSAAEIDPFSQTVLELYTGLVIGTCAFIELSILLHLEKWAGMMSQMASAEHAVQGARQRFPSSTCKYLRLVSTCGKDYLAVFAGSNWSISRLLLMSQIFVNTSAWDSQLFPDGATDKLASLIFLEKALQTTSLSYPSPELEEVLGQIATEKTALEGISGTLQFFSNVTSATLASSASSGSSPSLLPEASPGLNFTYVSNSTFPADSTAIPSPPPGFLTAAAEPLALLSPIAFDYPPPAQSVSSTSSASATPSGESRPSTGLFVDPPAPFPSDLFPSFLDPTPPAADAGPSSSHIPLAHPPDAAAHFTPPPDAAAAAGAAFHPSPGGDLLAMLLATLPGDASAWLDPSSELVDPLPSLGNVQEGGARVVEESPLTSTGPTLRDWTGWGADSGDGSSGPSAWVT